jgi:hypothetical protein
LAAKPVSFSRRTLLHEVRKYIYIYIHIRIILRWIFRKGEGVVGLDGAGSG